MMSPEGHKSVWIGHLLAFLLLEEGRLDAAGALLEQLPTTGDREMVTWRVGLLLTLAGLRGDRRPPAELDAMIGETSTYSFPMEALEALHDDIESAIRLNLSVDDIRARILPRWAEKGDRPPEQHVLNEAVLAAHDGRHDDAVVGLQASFARIADLHLPVFRQASLRLLLARSLTATGRRDDAAAEARAARAAAGPLAGLAARRCRRPARGVRRHAGRGRHRPQPREREVAALLAEGLSNAELARRLYISPKTAAVHVSNILAKLGMSSRAEVAAWAVRTGLAARSAPPPDLAACS